MYLKLITPYKTVNYCIKPFEKEQSKEIWKLKNRYTYFANVFSALEQASQTSYETDLSNEFRSFFAHFVQTVPCQSNHCSRPFCILHTSWYRAAGMLKKLVGTSLCGGHNLSPKIRIGLMYMIKISGDQPFRPCTFWRHGWWRPAARTHGQSHVS